MVQSTVAHLNAGAVTSIQFNPGGNMIEYYIYPDGEIYDSENDEGPPSNKSDDYITLDETVKVGELLDRFTYTEANKLLRRFFGEE